MVLNWKIHLSEEQTRLMESNKRTLWFNLQNCFKPHLPILKWWSAEWVTDGLTIVGSHVSCCLVFCFIFDGIDMSVCVSHNFDLEPVIPLGRRQCMLIASIKTHKKTQNSRVNRQINGSSSPNTKELLKKLNLEKSLKWAVTRTPNISSYYTQPLLAGNLWAHSL